MKIAIVGWGAEGQSAFRYFGPEHEYLIVSEERRDDFPSESEKIRLQFIDAKREPGVTGNVKDLSYLKGIENCDKIVYSVTNAKNLEKVYGQSPGFWQKATTITSIFLEKVKTKNVIGVTGTKGKGTTSTLIYKMLEEARLNVFIGGNIGRPVLDFLEQVTPNSWVVLELSSFQLYKMQVSPHIGVCLMIAPEHLDWHSDMEDYVNAKANLFRYQSADDKAIYFADNEYSTEIAGRSAGQKIPYYTSPGAYVDGDGQLVIDNHSIIHKSEVKLLGEHNLQNACAAITAVWYGLDSIDAQIKIKACREVLKSFGGLEHRLEMVRELNGIRFINDSFASGPGAAIGALRSIPGPKLMIMGGYDRQLPLDSIAQAAVKESDNIRQIILIGSSAERLAKALTQAGFSKYRISHDTNMKQIVATALETARKGDAVILSPGFASYDMFKNFEERGNVFKEAVNQL